MGLAHLIGPEEREWFRRCRRAWDFGSPNRRNLVPREVPDGEEVLLAALHMALAVWYFPGMWEWPRAIVEPRALQAFDEAAAGVPKGDAERARAMLERYFAWAPGVDAFSPVRVEADFEAGIPDPNSPGHELIDAGGRPVRYRDRIAVLLVDASDAYWVMEHRLVRDGWAGVDELLLAERSVAAAWGWEQFYLGMQFAGTVHNELRLDGAGHHDHGPAEGRVARHPRARDFARSRAAGGTPKEPRPAVTVEEGGAWFRRTWIRRPRPAIDAMGAHLSAEALDMLDLRLPLYPTPDPDHCGRCPYRSPCLAQNEGTDPDELLRRSYRLRPEDGPEEGRLGGGSWSMNRGAAPPPEWRDPPP